MKIAKLTKISKFCRALTKIKVMRKCKWSQGRPLTRRDSENYENYGNWENNKISKYCRTIEEKWRGNANEVKEGPLEAAKITKTTIIAEITKISRFFRALTKQQKVQKLITLFLAVDHYWWQQDELLGGPDKNIWLNIFNSKNANYKYLVTYFNNNIEQGWFLSCHYISNVCV